MSSDLKHKTVMALFWNFVEKFGQQLIYLLTGLVVSRIVTPAEYGLVGVLTIFIAFSTILAESGFSSSLIRKQDAREIDYSTIFLFNMGVSLFLYLLLFFTAPAIAAFYETPQITPVARILFLAVIFNSSAIVQQVQMTKKLEFKLLGKINLIALFFSSLISVVLATSGYGVWALVAQTVGLAFLRTLLLWVFGAWHISFGFDFGVIRSFFGYSSRLILVSAMNAVANNFYSLLIGKIYNRSDVGYYNQANKYQEMPAGIINNTFRSVLFPVLSRVNEDAERTKRVLRRIISMMSLIIFPVMFLLIVIAKPLIVALISDVWLPSVPIFQVLCIAGAFMPFTMMFGDSFSAMGRSGLTLRYEFVRKLLLFGGIALLFKSGIIALAWLWVGYMVVSVMLSLYYMRFTLHYSYSEFLGDAYRPFLTAAVLAVGLHQTTPFFNNMYLQMGVQIVIMGVLYLSVLFLLKDETLLDGIGMAKSRFKKE